jgi:hypothetical protein
MAMASLLHTEESEGNRGNHNLPWFLSAFRLDQEEKKQQSASQKPPVPERSSSLLEKGERRTE